MFTSNVEDIVCYHLESERFLPEEQKECRRKSSGTKDLLFIEKMISRNCKRRLTGLGIVWKDYKKACDMVPIVEEMYDYVAENMQMLLGKVEHGKVEDRTNNWRTEVRNSDNNKRLIPRRCFSPLHFVLAPTDVIAGYQLGHLRGKVSHLLFMNELTCVASKKNRLTQ